MDKNVKKEDNKIINRDIILGLVGIFIFAFALSYVDNIFMHWAIKLLILVGTIFFIGFVIYLLSD
ncbi:hypothetical protein D4R87_01295 [bacterium]|nr:MAG: hypothetical protein D4R87_01295 [bacterium]